jgi:CRISPR-associated endoribonuclease Cas6
MFRIRFCLPIAKTVSYQHLDIIHDALINAWIVAGASADQVLGFKSCHWNFAALGTRRGKLNEVHTLVVSTANKELAGYLANFNPAAIQYTRASTSEMVDFKTAILKEETNPILPRQNIFSALLLSPLVISKPAAKTKRWHDKLQEIDLSAAVNHRLTKLANRPVKITVQADSLYLRANPKHSVLVSLKHCKDSQQGFVIGMKAPLVLAGSKEDLSLAWYAGIGEKNRNGFGCLGLLEEGVGR